MRAGITARAVWFTAPGRMELREEQVSPPGPGQAQVQTLVSAVSHGTERLVYRGEIDPSLELDLPTLAGGFGYPIKYGYAAVGRVVALGEGVSGLHDGDLVFALHPHQERFTIDTSLLARLPADLEPERGVFYANLETALNVVHDTPLLHGETVAVFGLGTVGLLTAALLARSGAERVIAVDPLPARRDLATAFGCASTETPDAGLPARLREMTAGRGVDVAVETSGSPGALQTALDSLADEGTVVVASWYGRKPVELDLGGRFHRGRLRIRSSQVGRLSPDAAPRWDYARRSATVVRLLSELPVERLISHRMSFTDAADAYRLLDQPPDDLTQIVLDYEGR